MDREEILGMGERKLLNLIHEKFGITVNGLEDTKHLSEAWKVVEKLEEKGWRIDVMAKKGSREVDGIILGEKGPETIFAQYLDMPNFGSVTEGICKTALIILEEYK